MHQYEYDVVCVTLWYGIGMYGNGVLQSERPRRPSLPRVQHVRSTNNKKKNHTSR